MADINLLPREERVAAKFEQTRKRLTIISVVSLALTAVFTLGTLAFFTSAAATRSKLIKKIEESSRTINNLKAQEELVVVTKGKVQAVGKVLNLRTNFPNLFEKLSQLTPQGVYFTDIRFTSGKVVISGKAKTSADVAGLVSSLTSSKGSEVVSGVAVDSLASDDAGIYSFVVSGQLVTN